jgi:solute carrier family 25 carnitine/acylcarnitine transporter 20/29
VLCGFGPLQVGGTAASTTIYRGPFDCIRKSVATEGMGVLFRGLTATLLREIPGTAGFFGAYEFCIRVRVCLHPCLRSPL